MAAVLERLWEWWAKRDPLYMSDAELEESQRQSQEKRDRENKLRERLEGDEELMAALRRVAQTIFSVPKGARFVMVAPHVRILQVPVIDKRAAMSAFPEFLAENIELQPLPSWFMGKFYDFSMGYGRESKLVAWRLSAW